MAGKTIYRRETKGPGTNIYSITKALHLYRPDESSQGHGARAGAVQASPPELLPQPDTQAGEFQKERRVPTCPHPAVVTQMEPASVKAPHLHRQAPGCLRKACKPFLLDVRRQQHPGFPLPKNS